MSIATESGAGPRIEAPSRSPRVLRVALAGCGTVGGELLRILQERGSAIRAAHGLRFEVTRVLVRDLERPRPESLPRDRITNDVGAFLADAAEADIVVEAIGGLDTAGRIAERALGAGRVLVTANKSLVAERGAALAAMERRHGGRLLYEAAVAGGVPVVRALREALQQTGIRSVRGILNGTTNYILDRMSAGVRFEAALAEARALGFAEADPSRDLDGRDAADKVRILAWLAFQVEPEQVFVHRRGLLPRPDRIAADAAAFGGEAKLIGECVAGDAGVIATVEPIILPAHSPFARTRGAENLLVIETRHNGTIGLSGPGAGGSPTASAVLSDMIHGGASAPHAAPSEESDLSTGPRPSDDRLHAWVLSVDGSTGPADQLFAALREADIPVLHRRVDADDGVVRVLTGASDRNRVVAVERRLEDLRLAPVLTRFEAAEPEEAGS